MSVTYTSAQTAGNLNVVVVGWNDTTAAVSSVTDSSGNVYTLAVGPTKNPGSPGTYSLTQSIYYAANIVGAAASANTVTVRFSVAAVSADIRTLEYRGLSNSNPVDVTAAAIGTNATSNSGAATTTNANDLIVGGNIVYITLLLENIDPEENPRYFLTSVAEGLQIIGEVNSPQVRFLYDFFHEQIAEGNLIEKLDKHLDRVGLLHIADVPGRHEPGTGEINYLNIYKKLAQLKYDRYMAMEFLPSGDPVATLRAAREEALRAGRV